MSTAAAMIPGMIVETSATGTQTRFSPSQMFAHYAHHGFSFRCPADEVSGLIELAVEGECLDPVVAMGDRLFVDETLAPLPGDLVVFQARADTLASANAGALGEKWRAAYGHDIGPIVAKILVAIGRVNWLVCKDTMSRQASVCERIIGVVRAIDPGHAEASQQLAQIEAEIAGLRLELTNAD